MPSENVKLLHQNCVIRRESLIESNTYNHFSGELYYSTVYGNYYLFLVICLINFRLDKSWQLVLTKTDIYPQIPVH